MPEVQTVPVDPTCRVSKYGACPKIQQKNKGLSDQVKKSPSVKTTLDNDISKMKNVDQ